ncbi:hypothetical protein BVC80_243g38 [Macleaya cordata]|uniref:Uncharacterized protein n=1 Tax=Macleaya cordata TaxID=56857 RepID=A0A200R138_MACCD|nr:hypothetical protein BVC80_243g38 [Macleaya cordata]
MDYSKSGSAVVNVNGELSETPQEFHCCRDHSMGGSCDNEKCNTDCQTNCRGGECKVRDGHHVCHCYC